MLWQCWGVLTLSRRSSIVKNYPDARSRQAAGSIPQPVGCGRMGKSMSALTPELRKQIEAYIPRYPNKQAVTLPALHIVHDAMRCVSHEAVREIAEMLELSPAQIHDTMTFYEFFREEDAPLGKTRLWVCRSLPC